MTLPKRKHRVVAATSPAVVRNVICLDQGEDAEVSSARNELLVLLRQDASTLLMGGNEGLQPFLEAEGLDGAVEQGDPLWAELMEKVHHVVNLYDSEIEALQVSMQSLRTDVEGPIPSNSVTSNIVNLSMEHQYQRLTVGYRQKAIEVIRTLKRNYLARMKGRQLFPKEISRILNDWFYNHIQDPVRPLCFTQMKLI